MLTSCVSLKDNRRLVVYLDSVKTRSTYVPLGHACKRYIFAFIQEAKGLHDDPLKCVSSTSVPIKTINDAVTCLRYCKQRKS